MYTALCDVWWGVLEKHLLTYLFTYLLTCLLTCLLTTTTNHIPVSVEFPNCTIFPLPNCALSWVTGNSRTGQWQIGIWRTEKWRTLSFSSPVCHYPLLQFPPLRLLPSFSSPAMSSPAIPMSFSIPMRKIWNGNSHSRCTRRHTPRQIRSVSGVRIRITETDNFQNLTGTPLSTVRPTSAMKFSRGSVISFSEGYQPEYESCLCRSVEQSFEKFLYPHLEADDIQNVISSFLSTDTSPVKFSRRFHQ